LGKTNLLLYILQPEYKGWTISGTCVCLMLQPHSRLVLLNRRWSPNPNSGKRKDFLEAYRPIVIR